MRITSVLAVLATFVVLAGPLGLAPEAAHAGLSSSLSAASSSSDDRAIRRVFEDVLDREPSDREMRRYRELMDEADWSESDVRNDVRQRRADSGRRTVQSEDADVIVRRAYRDVLEREPDSAGLRNYRRRITEDQWTEREVRTALRKSPEFREKSTMTREKAEAVVRKAYLSVLGREPDEGSRGYVNNVLREQWTEQDVARELRRSDEYRAKTP